MRRQTGIWRRLACGAALVFAASAAMPTLSYAQDLMLGVFWNSDQDLSDTLYASADGVEFRRISTPIRTAGNGTDNAVGLPVNYVHAIHDPGLFYKDGNFWMVGGYVQEQAGLGWRLTPMLSSSSDLVHWSYPNSGSQQNLAPTTTPAGTQASGQYDSAGTEAFADDDGSVWLVTTLGYFAMNHGQSSSRDVMTPYICKVDGLRPGADQASDPGAQPSLSYGALQPINLPGGGQNWLDPSIYKENGVYYLSIKKDGVTNQIYATNDLNRASDPSAWTLVCGDVVTGYEGPSLTKLNGQYMMYTDKLKDYPLGAADGTAGTFVTQSGSLYGGWNGTRRINTLGRNADGSTFSIPNRHGSVLRVPDSAVQAVNSALQQAGWGAFDTTPTTPATPSNGTFSDVGAGAWYSDYVEKAASDGYGYMTGISGTTRFDPEGSLTRAQAAKVLFNMAGGTDVYDDAGEYDGTGGRGFKSFSDVDPNAWYAQPIAWAKTYGVVSGYPDGTFQPNKTVTREEFAKMLQNYAAKSSQGTDASADLSVYKDAGKLGWSRDAVTWAVANKAMGQDTDELRPQDNIKRSEVAKMSVSFQTQGKLDGKISK